MLVYLVPQLALYLNLPLRNLGMNMMLIPFIVLPAFLIPLTFLFSDGGFSTVSVFLLIVLCELLNHAPPF